MESGPTRSSQPQRAGHTVLATAVEGIASSHTGKRARPSFPVSLFKNKGSCRGPQQNGTPVSAATAAARAQLQMDPGTQWEGKWPWSPWTLSIYLQDWGQVVCALKFVAGILPSRTEEEAEMATCGLTATK